MWLSCALQSELTTEERIFAKDGGMLEGGRGGWVLTLMRDGSGLEDIMDGSGE